jgi:hypothetical protein
MHHRVSPSQRAGLVSLCGYVVLVVACRNVGFLHYFELKQLPNFLLAAPMLFISVSAIVHYAVADPLRFVTLGFRYGSWSSASLSQKRSSTPDAAIDAEAKTGSRAAMMSGGKFGSNPLLLCHVYLYTFLVLVATFIMHVQVATRFLATSPVLYWWLADRLLLLQPPPPPCDSDSPAEATTAVEQKPTKNEPSRNSAQDHALASRGVHGAGRRSRRHRQGDQRRSPSPSPPSSPSSGNEDKARLWETAVLHYFTTYCVLGCALFSNYYPWT